jgi:hypothetical protein
MRPCQFHFGSNYRSQLDSRHRSIDLNIIPAKRHESLLQVVSGRRDGPLFILVADRRPNESVAQCGPYVMSARADVIKEVMDFHNGWF